MIVPKYNSDQDHLEKKQQCDGNCNIPVTHAEPTKHERRMHVSRATLFFIWLPLSGLSEQLVESVPQAGLFPRCKLRVFEQLKDVLSQLLFLLKAWAFLLHVKALQLFSNTLF